MLVLALSTLRFRKPGFAGAFIALFFAAALVGACGMLLETGLRGGIPAERYAGTPVVVAGDQSAHTVERHNGKVKVKAQPFGEHVWIPATSENRLRSLPGVRAVVPELQFPAYVVTARPVPGPGGTPSLGHAWASARLTPFTLGSGRAPEAPSDVVVDAGLAHRAGLVVGSRVIIEATGIPSSYRVSGITAQTLNGQAALFFSPSEAQRLAGHQGEVAAIGLLPRAETSPSTLAAEARSALAGTGAIVYTGDQRGPLEFPDAAKARTMLISLAGVMGGAALLIAIGVVTGTLALSIRQRYREIALLRAVGATPRQVRKMIGREALVVGVVAATAGSAASAGLAAWLWGRFVAGAVPDILHLSTSPYPMFAAVGATLAAAWVAARVAGRTVIRVRPAEALAEAAVEQPATGATRLLAGGGLLAGAITLTVVLSRLTAEPAATPVIVLTALMWVTAMALLGPVIVRMAVATVGVPLGVASRFSGYLAVADLRTNARRYASAVMPVSLAVTMTCTILFSQSTLGHAVLAQTRAATLADYVLTAPKPGIPSAAAASLRTIPGVAGVTEVIQSSVLGTGLEKYTVTGVTPENLDQTLDVGVRAGSMNDLRGNAVAVSDRDTGVRLGGTLRVRLGDGTPVSLQVVAIYSRGLGVGDLIVPRDLVAAHVDDPLDDEVLVRAAPGAGDIRSALTARISDVAGAQVLSGAGIQAWQVAQPWVNADIQYLAMGLIIAFALIAVVNTLIMAILDRRREFTFLRMIGATRSQVRRLARWESFMITLIAVAGGTVMSLLTLMAFAHAMTGSWTPSIPAPAYLAVVAGAAAVTLLTTEAAARSAAGPRRHPAPH